MYTAHFSDSGGLSNLTVGRPPLDADTLCEQNDRRG